MDNKIEKKNKTIHFIEKWFIIGIILFIAIQVGCLAVIKMTLPKDQRESFDKEMGEFQEDYIGHWYNGTYFINMMISENFDSKEKYDEMISIKENDALSKTCYYTGTAASIIGLVLIIIAAYKEHKKKLIDGNTPIIITLSGLFFLIFKFFEELDLIIDVNYYSKYSIGFLNTGKYYPMVYNIFIIPTLLILLGLILRQIQRKDNKEPTKTNETIIKSILGLIIIVGYGFILHRFGIRVYELINMNKVTIRLPYYYNMLDLPRYFVSSASSYRDLIILRFVKDLPVFIASSISIVLFVKIIRSYIKEEYKDNKKRYLVLFISLIISSILFNVLGIAEVNLLNKEFLYQYKEATYTIAIRSLTEPLLYGFFIYIFKHYIELALSMRKHKGEEDE